MFSATFPDPIRKVASEFLHAYLFLSGKDNNHGDKNDFISTLISWWPFAVGVVGGACQDVRQKFIQVKKVFLDF